MEKHRVVVAMSGGVDSSVAALMLHQEGYEVLGVTMRLWTVEDTNALPHNKRCCSVEDVDDARRVCQVIGVPHYVLNLEREFQAYVVDYFCREYQRGRTPHPCLACNDRLKFDYLLKKALALGASYVATGHYARVQRDNGVFYLLKAEDPTKDQSYVLFNLGQEQLSRTLFPVGQYPKVEIRRLAQQAGLPVADKPDSQEICFIPQGNYKQFLASRLEPSPGEIVDTLGNVLGSHQGIEFFTVGQRRGLGVVTGEKTFVVKIDVSSRRVVVGSGDELLQPALIAEDVNYTHGQEPDQPTEVMAKIRYKFPEVKATLYPKGSGATIVFHSPQRAVTPGQAVVFYQGERVLGGGIIREALSEADPVKHSQASAVS